VREIRTLRAMWRALETELRQLLNGHAGGNLGYKPRRNLPATAPAARERVRGFADVLTSIQASRSPRPSGTYPS
jgi:hypothetical protein